MAISEAKNSKNIGILYGLEDKPPFLQSALTALQHLMSMVISIGAPPLIICRALNMPIEISIYLVNMSFLMSGIGTLIQTNRLGPVGSGLLSIQATSFIFPTAFIALGKAALDAGHSKEEVIALMSGATVAGSCIQIILSRMTKFLKKIFTPLVCGVTVTLVGISLINVAMQNALGGAGSDPAVYASANSVIVSASTLLVIIIFNSFKNPMLRMSAMIAGFVFGLILAYYLGCLNMEKFYMYKLFGFIPIPWPLDATLFSMPYPLKYGIDFGFAGFLSIALLYVIVTVEVTGDLSATCMLSNEPTSGSGFMKRLSGGIMGGGVSSFISGFFNSFPTAIFAQNSGVIQLTGNASRHVGKYIAFYLLIMGVFPIIGAFFTLVPNQVLGGALILLFGIITSTGMRLIFSRPLTRRAILILSSSLGIGIGAAFQPDFTKDFPNWLADLFHSPVAIGGMTAILGNLFLPRDEEDKQAMAAE